MATQEFTIFPSPKSQITSWLNRSRSSAEWVAYLRLAFTTGWSKEQDDNEATTIVVHLSPKHLPLLRDALSEAAGHLSDLIAEMAVEA